MRRCLAGLLLALAGCASNSSENSAEAAATTPNGEVTSPSTSGTAASANPSTAGVMAGSTQAVGAAGTSAAGASGVATPATSASSSNGGVAGAASAQTGAMGMTASAGTPATMTSRDMGNFFESGSWHGYVFVAAEGAGTTISPMDFSMQTTGMPRCVKGSVEASMDYSAIAQLGFELTDAGGVTPTKAGVQIEVTNTAGSTLRFQVESADGSTRWCAPLSGSGGFIEWSSLNTACWDDSGMAYNNEPIAKAMVLVPSEMSAAVAFDFCVNKLAEADAPAAGADPGAGAAGMMSTDPGASGMSGTSGMSTTGGNTTVEPLQGGCDGYATGYWDCCKTHCGWKDNVPGGSQPLATCDQSDNLLGNADAQSACQGGPAHMCHMFVPWAVNDKLSYGYSAVSASAGSDICGKCYQLQFTGVSFNAGEDPGSTAIAGKTMIVQATNIGSDVANGQFDISIPGRGVGMFNACSAQWGVPNSELGETYGGFLPVCKRQVGRTAHAELKSCVMQSCMNVFEARGLTELAAGCKWFVDWMEVADNPSVKYKEVECPAELSGKGIQRSGSPSNSCLR